MNDSKDQLGREVVCKSFPPERIISLVPSQTELLYDLGLDNQVKGITKFCVHPRSWFLQKERVGGTKNVHTEKVRDLQPDLILANKEENIKEQIEQLEQIAPVWVSDIHNFDDAMKMITAIGTLVKAESEAHSLTARITAGFSRLQTCNSARRTAYLIWRDPYISVGGETFINNMLQKCGLENVFEDQPRYPEITIQQLASAKPELILLSSEPYPFKEQHVHELKHHFSGSQILLVDGEMFSWYGSRMLYMPDYFLSLSQMIDNN